MVLTLALIAIAIASGTLITYSMTQMRHFSPAYARASASVLRCSDSSAFTTHCPLTDGSKSVLTTATLACALLLLIAPAIRSRLSGDIRSATHRLREMVLQPRHHVRAICLVFLYILFAVIMERFFSRAVFERDGAILTGAINNIGDLPLHTSMVTSFAYGANFPPEHSQFTGARLTYPFLADFISAFFIRTGVSLTTAMYLQTVFLMVALPALGYRWALN